MNQNAKFNDVLNDCLDRMFKGESVEDCLALHAEFAQELEPLLRTAKAARIASTIQPRPEFKARARYDFMAAANELAAKKQRRSAFSWFPQWRWQSGWAVGMIAFLVVVVGGGSTVAAASTSMPGSALYSLKLATENAQLALTPSDVGKAELNAKFANRRVEEIGYVANQGNAREVQIVAARLNTNLSNMTQITSKNATHNAAALNGPANSGVNRATGSGGEASGAGLNAQPPMVGAASPAAVPGVAQAVGAPQASATPEQSATALVPAPTGQAAAPPKALAVPTPTVLVGSAGADNQFSGSAAGTNSTQNALQLSPEQAELAKIIEDNYNQRQSLLQATLANASPAVRPAVRQAIAESQAQYEQEMSNLYAGN